MRLRNVFVTAIGLLLSVKGSTLSTLLNLMLLMVRILFLSQAPQNIHATQTCSPTKWWYVLSTQQISLYRRIIFYSDVVNMTRLALYASLATVSQVIWEMWFSCSELIIVFVMAALISLLFALAMYVVKIPLLCYSNTICCKRKKIIFMVSFKRAFVLINNGTSVCLTRLFLPSGYIIGLASIKKRWRGIKKPLKAYKNVLIKVKVL